MNEQVLANQPELIYIPVRTQDVVLITSQNQWRIENNNERERERERESFGIPCSRHDMIMIIYIVVVLKGQK